MDIQSIVVIVIMVTFGIGAVYLNIKCEKLNKELEIKNKSKN